MEEKKFIDGLRVKQPHPNAPEFIKAKISINKQSLLQWLSQQPDEWINVDVKESKTGNWYAEIDTWKPEASTENPRYATQPDTKEEFNDQVPF